MFAASQPFCCGRQEHKQDREIDQTMACLYRMRIDQKKEAQRRKNPPAEELKLLAAPPLGSPMLLDIKESAHEQDDAADPHSRQNEITYRNEIERQPLKSESMPVGIGPVVPQSGLVLPNSSGEESHRKIPARARYQ